MHSVFKHCLIWGTAEFVLLLRYLFIIHAEPGYEFDKSSLLEYNHMSFGGPPVTTETVEEADELLRSDEEESAIGNKAFLEKFYSLLRHVDAFLSVEWHTF